MVRTIQNPLVEMYLNGRVVINCNEFRSEDIQAVMERFDKKVSGRMYHNKERSELVFDPYNTGQNPSIVRQKEVVGQVVVTKSQKHMKFSLSLPLSMSQSLMSLTLLEQASLVSQALQAGLYERMMNGATGESDTTVSDVETESENGEPKLVA